MSLADTTTGIRFCLSKLDPRIASAQYALTCELAHAGATRDVCGDAELIFFTSLLALQTGQTGDGSDSSPLLIRPRAAYKLLSR